MELFKERLEFLLAIFLGLSLVALIVMGIMDTINCLFWVLLTGWGLFFLYQFINWLILEPIQYEKAKRIKKGL